MPKQEHLFDRIRILMDAGGIEPTPANYEFWYRYALGADARLVEAVDAVLETKNRLSARAMENIRRELYGDDFDLDLATLMASTQEQLEKMGRFFEGEEARAIDFEHLLPARPGRGAPAAAATDRNRLLTAMISATDALITKAEGLEKRLADSCGEVDNLRKDLHAAQSESRTDALTGLNNRKAFHAYLQVQAARALADRKPLTLAFGDIDHFKKFNDKWGHRLGDDVLRLVGQSLEKMCHGLGYPARYGGEEFVIVLPGRDLESASDICEQIRDVISSRTIRARGTGDDVGAITLSLGIAQLAYHDEPEDLIERADAALYLAKKLGRNRVCVETELDRRAVA